MHGLIGGICKVWCNRLVINVKMMIYPSGTHLLALNCPKEADHILLPQGNCTPTAHHQSVCFGVEEQKAFVQGGCTCTCHAFQHQEDGCSCCTSCSCTQPPRQVNVHRLQRQATCHLIRTLHVTQLCGGSICGCMCNRMSRA